AKGHTFLIKNSGTIVSTIATFGGAVNATLYPGLTQFELTDNSTLAGTVPRNRFLLNNRQTFGDANVTVLPQQSSIIVVSTSANLTAPRTATLPAISQLSPGQLVLIVDGFGGVSAANTLTTAPNGADTGGAVVLNRANDFVLLEANTTLSSWTLV